MSPEPFSTPSAPALLALLDTQPGLRLSLYHPVPAGPGFDELSGLQRSFVQAVKAAHSRMADLGLTHAELDAFDRRMSAIEVERTSMPAATRGLAVFDGPSGTSAFCLNRSCAAASLVGRSHAIRPMLASLQEDCRFRILGLTTNAVELFEGDAWTLRSLDRDGVPASLEDALGSELTDPALQAHSGASGGSGLIFHGHGGAKRERALDRDRFHKALAAALRKRWRDGGLPIVLVADRAHAGRFRKVAELPELLEEGLALDARKRTDEGLRSLAAELVRRWSRERWRAALDQARAVPGRGRTVDDLGEAARAAVEGRVERVFVAESARRAQHINSETGSLEEAHGDEDALDELCGHVLLRGGSAVVLDDEPALGSAGLLAELRGT